MDRLLTVLYRLAFLVALTAAGLAVVEGIVQVFGRTIVHGVYSAGRLLEFSGIAMILVILLLLRDIRDDARGKRG